MAVDPHSLSSFEEQHLSIPGSAAEALRQLHAAAGLQVSPGMLRHVPAQLQTLEVVEVGTAELAEPARRGPIALPGLRLQDEVLADGRQAGEEPQQSRVAVVQVDPHGDGETETHVEAGTPVASEVVPQRILPGHRGVRLPGDIERDKGDVLGERVGPLGAQDEAVVQVEAQEMSAHRLLMILCSRHQMSVQSHTQVLGGTYGNKEGLISTHFI